MGQGVTARQSQNAVAARMPRVDSGEPAGATDDTSRQSPLVRTATRCAARQTATRCLRSIGPRNLGYAHGTRSSVRYVSARMSQESSPDLLLHLAKGRAWSTRSQSLVR